MAFDLNRFGGLRPSRNSPMDLVSQNPPQDSLNFDDLEHDTAAKRSGPFDEAFERLVGSYLDRFHVPSLSIAVVEGKEIHSNAYGFAKKPDVVATPETLYYAGSTTKSFTAAALTILIDDYSQGGELIESNSPLSLQTPIVDIVPGFRLRDDYATLQTTLEDALCHRSGLAAHDAIYGGENYTSDDLLKALPFLPLTEPFRTRYQYCNILYMVLSRAVEKLAGNTLAFFLGDRIWAPLHMNSTYFSLADARKAESMEGKVLARGYYWDAAVREWVAERHMDEQVVSGAGHIITTVNDYARYLRSMIHRSYPISPKGHQELRSPRIFPKPGAEAPEFLPTTYGLGWVQTLYRGETIQWHGGGLHGFGALIAFIPSREWGVTMLSNTELSSQFVELTIMFHLVDSLLGVPQDERMDFASYYEKKMHDMNESYLNGKRLLYPNIPEPPLKLSIPLEEYAGEYTHPAYRNLTLRLAHPTYPGVDRDSGPVLHFDMLDRAWPSVFDFEHVSGDCFVAWRVPAVVSPSLSAKSAMKAEFRIGEDGKASELGIRMEPMMGEDKIWWKKIS